MKIRSWRNLCVCVGVLVALMVAGVGLRAQDKVPAQFQGDWVPATAACDSAVRFRVTESKMTLINGADKAEYGGLGTTASYFGDSYQGISVVFLPELNGGNPPFTVFFQRRREKRCDQGGHLYLHAGAVECAGKNHAGGGQEIGHAIPD